MRFATAILALILALFAGIAVQNIGVFSCANNTKSREASHAFDRYTHEWVDDGRYGHQHNLALSVL